MTTDRPITLPPLPAELFGSGDIAREYARAAVQDDRAASTPAGAADDLHGKDRKMAAMTLKDAMQSMPAAPVSASTPSPLAETVDDRPPSRRMSFEVLHAFYREHENDVYTGWQGFLKIVDLIVPLAQHLPATPPATPAAPVGQAEPTDVEIAALADEHGISGTARGIRAHEQRASFARAVLARWGATPQAARPAAQGAVKRWPFAASPGEVTERVAKALMEFEGDLLAALRNVFIEQGEPLAAQPAEPSKEWWDYEVMIGGGEWIPESRDNGPPDTELFAIRNLRKRAARAAQGDIPSGGAEGS